MRYRRMSYRYAFMLAGQQPRFVGDPWQLGRAGVTVAQPRWRPPADVYETRTEVSVVVELPGVDQEELEVLLFEDAVVVQGERHLTCDTGGRYHAAEIRQGPFRLETVLPASIDPDRVEARYDHGILTITLPKQHARRGRDDG